MPRKTKPIVILGDEKSGAGGSRQIGRSGRGKKNKWGAAFVPSKKWEVYINSRDLQAVVGSPLFRHIKAAVAAGRSPETGRAHPRLARDTAASRHRANPINVSGGRHENYGPAYMAKHLTRTVTNSSKRWGGGFKRLGQGRSRMKFYFADKTAAAINKADANRKGKYQALWLGLGGSAGGKFGPAIGRWADAALDGKNFDRDTRQKARTGTPPGTKSG